MPHLFGLVAKPGVEDSLIDAFQGTVAGEAVAKNLIAAQLFPACYLGAQWK